MFKWVWGSYLLSQAAEMVEFHWQAAKINFIF